MSVVTGALGSLAPKLFQLIHGEYKLQKGVKKQLQWLHSELQSIYAFLQEVSEVPWDRLNEQVKVWVRQVREASYDMEDVLDTYLVRVDGGEPTDPSRLKRAMKKMGKVFTKAKACRGIAGAIQDIKKFLEEIAERRQRYKLDEIMSKHDTTKSSIDPRLSAMYKEMTQLIGMDKSMEDVISLLYPSHTENAVFNKNITKKVSIVGVGGLGKTTLAKAVYDKLSSEYECGAFVSVGRDHDLANVFKDILFRLDKVKYHNIHTTGRGVELLINELREFLKNKRYFVVVDDVWDVKTCKIIKSSLIENCCGSKVITTTRKFDVAEEAGEVYKLKPLSYENSKKLFYTRVLGTDGQYPDNKPDDVSDKILKRCAGIPLAIIAVTSLLAGKPKDEWYEVYSSIGFRHKDNTDVEDIMKILSFSYYDMPSHLQTCLLYLSTYPEDTDINKDELIWKWIAEGFVHEQQGERFFEVGERYFNDLINRSMIQAVHRRSEDIVCGCRVHDIVLDLLRRIAFEENFIAILDGNAAAISGPSNVRRFALHNRIAQHVSSQAKDVEMPKVRSYTAFRCDINNNWVYFPSFRLLRVLDLKECKFKEGCHLEHLGDLLHLRYLRIHCQGSTPKLSKQITNLKLLQTLVLYGTLPVSFDLPTKLLCLHAQSVPDGIGKLTSLEELIIQGYPKMFLKELGSLRELRVLIIFDSRGMDNSMQRDFVVSLSNLQKVKKIEMFTMGSFNADTAMWEEAGFVLPRCLRHLKMSIYFSKMPSCINPSCLPNLSYLLLRVDTMDEHDMEHLARLPTLSHLILTIKYTVTASITNARSDACFQKLRYFKINAVVQIQQHNKEGSCISLHIWNRGEGALPFGSWKSNCSKNVPSAMMPNLEVLCIHVSSRALRDNKNYCGNIGIEYLPSIMEVKVDIDCRWVSSKEVDAALAALRNTCKVHPNHPMLVTHTLNEAKMVSTQDNEEEEQQQEAEMASQAVNNMDLGRLSSASS